MATPAIIVYVPDQTVELQPVRVHVDPTTLTIQGYSVTTPGAAANVEGGTIFLPPVEHGVAPTVASIPGLNFQEGHCVEQNISLPALPFPLRTPEILVETPEVTTEVPVFHFNLFGETYTVGGQIITVAGQRILIPEREFQIHRLPVEPPERTIIIEVGDEILEVVDFLPHVN